MHLFKKYLNFSNKINFCNLAIDLENGVNVKNIVKSLDCPKCIAALDLWESNKRFKRYINFSEISPI